MHDPDQPRPSAQIIQFRPRTATAAAALLKLNGIPVTRGPAWYHEEAITDNKPSQPEDQK